MNAIKENTMYLYVNQIEHSIHLVLHLVSFRSKARTKRLHYKGPKKSKKPRRAPTEETLLGAAS